MNKLSFLLLLLVSTTALGQVRFARLFSDHMVLQRQQPIPVWGWAKPGETVRVTLAGQSQQAKADGAGKWQVRFTPLEAGGPHELLASAKSGQVKAADVLVGEVWLCSGQSNMEWPVKQADNYAQERKTANFPQVRQFFVAHELALTPQTDLPSGEWKACSPQTVGDFTAVGYFFARDLTQKLNVPIGLIHSSWGGSQVEGWISKERMLTSDDLRTYAQNLPTNWQQADSLTDQKLRRQLRVSPTLTTADEARYVQPDHDLSAWRKTEPTGQWEWKDMRGFTGQGYMARSIDVPAELAAASSTLVLAENDGPTRVYINGKLIADDVVKGTRKLTIPANTWQAGPNRLVLKLGPVAEPNWFGTGLKGANSDLYLQGEFQRISLGSDWYIMPAFAEPHTYKRFMNNVGVSIYNAMIAPLIPYGIRGALWYQGETNAGRAYQYRQSFPLMIQDWRQRWAAAGNPAEFPFYFVQLASYGGNQDSNKGSNWAELREAQTMTLSLPNTGMAVTTDIGNPRDIHPTNKQDVGHRLAAVALKQAYAQAVPGVSPLYDGVSFDGNKATIRFKNVPTGLMAKDKYGYVRGFEIAGEDKVFHYAKAEIQGDKLVVSSPDVPRPAAVRYAWTDSPDEANLYNREGFPISPFRTDDWPMLTRQATFE